MAVLVEAISIIVKKSAMEIHLAGGWNDFVATLPNDTLCHDDDLARIGFMHPSDVHNYVQRLESLGLEFTREGAFSDIAVVDQRQGPTLPTPWLEFARVRIGEGPERVSACWLFEGSREFGGGIYMRELSMSLAIPDGWRYESSLSAQSQFVPTGEVEQRLKFLRRENGLDVFLDLGTGEERRVARTK